MIINKINKLLTTCEEGQKIDILYACESGSRAWGFASPNSDFDIRFLYRSPHETYLSVFEQKDTIEIPIKDDLDPGGWDIKKALGLLAKSNGALIEWLHSPIVYKDQEGFREHAFKDRAYITSIGFARTCIHHKHGESSGHLIRSAQRTGNSKQTWMSSKYCRSSRPL